MDQSLEAYIRGRRKNQRRDRDRERDHDRRGPQDRRDFHKKRVARRVVEGKGRHDEKRFRRERREDYRDDRREDEGGKVFVTNLHYSLLKNDLQVERSDQALFERVGPVVSCRLHYDPIGRSEVGKTEQGTGVVEFEHAEDARRAIEKFDGRAEVDGLTLGVEEYDPLRHSDKNRGQTEGRERGRDRRTNAQRD